MVVVVVGVLTMVVVVVVVGGRSKGFPQEVLGSHVTASDLERLMSERFSPSESFLTRSPGARLNLSSIHPQGWLVHWWLLRRDDSDSESSQSHLRPQDREP
jgi:hypothetical protein